MKIILVIPGISFYISRASFIHYLLTGDHHQPVAGNMDKVANNVLQLLPGADLGYFEGGG